VVIYDSAWEPTEASDDSDNSVSDEYYNGLEMVEYTHHTMTDSLMFAVPDTTMALPTFNGPIRLANTVDAPNVAGAPGLHYVVFEPGVINAWHTHPGGQILIATDGIGYHQIEGQPVEVLHPGDVVMCPPNVKHWHGAAPNSRFAHLAAGTNPDRPAVVWTDEMLSKEEYERLPKE
jgi:quercetin dioxygenase-like cupin family protein